jgi:DNA transposition AAA+ family ATPase
MDTLPTEAIEAMNSKKFRIPGDIVNKATAELPDHQRNAIRWLHAYADEKDLSLSELGRIIRYDESTLHRVFHGKYEGNLDRVSKEIEGARGLIEERSKGRKLEFIETALARRIWNYCDKCLEYQRIGFIVGDSQIGKTTAIQRYAQIHNHGSTVLVRMPAGGAVTQFLVTIARALRISPQQREKELIRRITAAFDDRMLLIVDEVHQCCLRNSAIIGGRTVEFIREIYDNSGCGVVLVSTPVFEEEMEFGRFNKLLLQLKRRRLPKLKLPASPDAKDLDTIAAAYRLPPARGESLDLQTRMIRDEALGMWLCLLRMAAKLAHKRSEPMDWKHVQKAHSNLVTLEA